MQSSSALAIFGRLLFLLLVVRDGVVGVSHERPSIVQPTGSSPSNEATQAPSPAPAAAPAAVTTEEQSRETPEFTKREGVGLERAPGQQNQVARNCQRLPAHRIGYVDGEYYFFSWLDSVEGKRQLNWNAARSFCKSVCLDLAVIESQREQDMFNDRIRAGDVYGAWIGGRLCTSGECTSDPAFYPNDSPAGWLWAPTGAKMTSTAFAGWSRGGAMGRPQPDNLVNVHGGRPEECLAVLNDWYGDGIAWHDMPCSEPFPFVCKGV